MSHPVDDDDDDPQEKDEGPPGVPWPKERWDQIVASNYGRSPGWNVYFEGERICTLSYFGNSDQFLEVYAFSDVQAGVPVGTQDFWMQNESKMRFQSRGFPDRWHSGVILNPCTSERCVVRFLYLGPYQNYQNAEPGEPTGPVDSKPLRKGAGAPSASQTGVRRSVVRWGQSERKDIVAFDYGRWLGWDVHLGPERLGSLSYYGPRDLDWDEYVVTDVAEGMEIDAEDFWPRHTSQLRFRCRLRTDYWIEGDVGLEWCGPRRVSARSLYVADVRWNWWDRWCYPFLNFIR